MPWSLQEPAMRIMAHRLNRRIFCITAEAVSPELLQAGDDLDSTGHAFYTDLYTMIDTLPLPYKLILMDNTFGLGVPLLWKLQSRLKHILAVNTSWVFRLGFVHSSTHKVLADRAASLKTLAEQRDIKGMVKACGDFILAPRPECTIIVEGAVAFERAVADTWHIYNEYEAGLASASDNFWQSLGEADDYTYSATDPRLSHMQPWRPEHSIDIVLAYGSHTPTLAVQDATFNLQEMLPGSLTAVIAQSSWLWQLEGHVLP
ncbi:rab13 [Symbiodinium necroappetens]|uniref:Rab13 protein n=1 Tax=Symbiodinium necroappetens TaxID=1628268 RepID=A0A812NT82_9DINO|nr:rab13 [Symbiodinium necroappetens]